MCAHAYRQVNECIIRQWTKSRFPGHDVTGGPGKRRRYIYDKKLCPRDEKKVFEARPIVSQSYAMIEHWGRARTDSDNIETLSHSGTHQWATISHGDIIPRENVNRSAGASSFEIVLKIRAMTACVLHKIIIAAVARYPARGKLMSRATVCRNNNDNDRVR